MESKKELLQKLLNRLLKNLFVCGLRQGSASFGFASGGLRASFVDDRCFCSASGGQ